MTAMRGRLWSLALYLFVVGVHPEPAGNRQPRHGHRSFAKRWFGTPLPPQFTTDWFVYAWREFDLDRS